MHVVFNIFSRYESVVPLHHKARTTSVDHNKLRKIISELFLETVRRNAFRCFFSVEKYPVKIDIIEPIRINLRQYNFATIALNELKRVIF